MAVNGQFSKKTYTMKKAFLWASRILIVSMLVTAFPNTISGQQKEKKPQNRLLHVKLFLHKDSVVEGYLMNFVNHGGMYNKSQINTNDSLIKLRPLDAKLFAKDQRYNFRDIDSMYTWLETMPDECLKWVPMRINMAYGHGEPMIPDHLVMLAQIFQGRHVVGYMGLDDVLGKRIYYRTKDMDHAKAIHRASGKLTDKRKGTLRDEFSNLPDMVNYIDSLGKVDLNETPLDILKKLDSVLDGKP